MYLLIIAWVYVVVMMAVSEATSTQGTVLGALLTFLSYGVLPLSIVLYLMGTPGRRARRRREEAAAAQKHRDAGEAGSQPGAEGASGPPLENGEKPASGQSPDGGGEAAGGAIAPERKEP
jgi:hypothetical protein